MTPSLIYCPKCGGDGYHIHLGGSGYYSMRFGNHLPSETEVPCETCEGEIELCAVCRSTEGLCICTEDEMGVAA